MLNPKRLQAEQELLAREVRRARWCARNLALVAEHARRISVQLRRLARVKGELNKGQRERWVFLSNQLAGLGEPATLCDGLVIEENGRPFRP